MTAPVVRVVSGIQPTGDLHLGNYLGAIRRWVELQGRADCFFFLADLHAVTVHVEPARLRANVRAMAAALIASGVEPANLFPQSRVPAHPEMAWLLQCTARVGWLNRMTQFKEKAGKDREGSSVGLYTYPVLQAADILLYRPSHVPVGEDQKQHIELARDVALKFNTDYDTDLLVPPEPLIEGPAPRVMSLRDGRAKMSKSDPSDMSRLNLTDDDDALATKVRKAKTDPEPLPDGMDALADRPEARNLVTIFAALAGEEAAATLGRFAGQGFGAFKPALAELAVETLRPIRERYVRLLGDPAELDRQLDVGAERAREAAGPVLDGAYRALGLR